MDSTENELRRRRRRQCLSVTKALVCVGVIITGFVVIAAGIHAAKKGDHVSMVASAEPLQSGTRSGSRTIPRYEPQDRKGESSQKSLSRSIQAPSEIETNGEHTESQRRASEEEPQSTNEKDRTSNENQNKCDQETIELHQAKATHDETSTKSPFLNSYRQDISAADPNEILSAEHESIAGMNGNAAKGGELISMPAPSELLQYGTRPGQTAIPCYEPQDMKGESLPQILSPPMHASSETEMKNNGNIMRDIACVDTASPEQCLMGDGDNGISIGKEQPPSAKVEPPSAKVESQQTVLIVQDEPTLPNGKQISMRHNDVESEPHGERTESQRRGPEEEQQSTNDKDRTSNENRRKYNQETIGLNRAKARHDERYGKSPFLHSHRHDISAADPNESLSSEHGSIRKDDSVHIGRSSGEGKGKDKPTKPNRSSFFKKLFRSGRF